MYQYIVTLMIASVLLAGCTSSEQPTTLPDVPPSTAQTFPSTAPTLPWISGDETSMGYEEYFSEVRPYQVEDGSLYFGRSWGDHSITYGEGELFVTDVQGNVLLCVPNVDTTINWVACDSHWIYGIRNEHELLRVNYQGINEEVLFRDNVHTIGLEHSGDLFLGEECTLFFAACSDTGSQICRLYLPTLTMDVLAESDSSLLTLTQVLSNHEVVWSEENPAFVELLEGLTDEELAQYPGDDLADWVSGDYKVAQTFLHYENDATGAHRSMSNFGAYYTERTAENIAANGTEWWKDIRS